jgi:hypothetical protein
MGKDVPQQPELRRSGRGETDPEGRRVAHEIDERVAVKGRAGPVPPANRPGHRPERDQDKPAPRRGKRR